MSEHVPSVGRRVDKPWGYEIIWAETPLYIGKILHVERDQQLSLQYHREKDETMYLLSGLLEVELSDDDGRQEKLTLRPGQSLRITPRLRHRMTALETSEILEASTPHPHDLVRLEDRYGRS